MVKPMLVLKLCGLAGGMRVGLQYKINYMSNLLAIAIVIVYTPSNKKRQPFPKHCKNIVL